MRNLQRADDIMQQANQANDQGKRDKAAALETVTWARRLTEVMQGGDPLARQAAAVALSQYLEETPLFCVWCGADMPHVVAGNAAVCRVCGSARREGR